MGRTIHYQIFHPPNEKPTDRDLDELHEINDAAMKGAEWTCETPDFSPFQFRLRQKFIDESDDAWDRFSERLSCLQGDGLSHRQALQRLDKEGVLTFRDTPTSTVGGKYPKHNVLTRHGAVRLGKMPTGVSVVTVLRLDEYDLFLLTGKSSSKKYLHIIRAPWPHERVLDRKKRALEVSRQNRDFPSFWVFDVSSCNIEKLVAAALKVKFHLWDRNVYRSRALKNGVAAGFTKVAGNEWNAFLIYHLAIVISKKWPKWEICIEDEGSFSNCIPLIIQNGTVRYNDSFWVKPAQSDRSEQAMSVRETRTKEICSFVELAKTRSVFKIVEPTRYAAHEKFQGVVVSDAGQGAVVIQGGPEKVPIVAENDVAAMCQLFTESLAKLDWLGYGDNYETPVGDKTGANLNAVVEFVIPNTTEEQYGRTKRVRPVSSSK